MQSVSTMALSGMAVATASLGVSGHNLANLGTAGFRRQIASPETLPSGGVTSRLNSAVEPGNAIETDLVGLVSAKHSFLANLAVFRTSAEMAGTLLDKVA
jgi:flagellar hook protein FlgE